jgi:uncharacterized protein involved in exopolysaccharide biosynthesis
VSTRGTDVIDLGELMALARRKAWWVAAGAAVGIVVALAIWAVLPRSYEAQARVLLRSGNAEEPSLGRLGSLGALAGVPGMLGATGFETEMEILTSRSSIGAVVDSLGLQASVIRPRGTASAEVLSVGDASDLDGTLRVEVRRRDAGFELRGGGSTVPAQPGQPVRVGGVDVTVAAGAPDGAVVEIRDRVTTVERIERSLKGRRAGGDVAKLTYTSRHPGESAQLLNALIERYLVRRQTSDRGVNQRRYEYIGEHLDSISRELAAAEDALRAFQERTAVIDPEMQGRAELEQGLALRGNLEALNVEARGLERFARGGERGRRVRDLAAYPTFLRTAGVNDLYSQLLELDGDRAELLVRRTEADPEVRAVTASIVRLEDQLEQLAFAYLEGVNRQRDEIQRELQRYQSDLAALPAHAQESFRLQREVRRLSETFVMMQTQLVQARLAAIQEGGDVRVVDPAEPPRRHSWPKGSLFLIIGAFAGTVGGALAGIGTGYLGRGIRTPWDATLVTGLPAIELTGEQPLLLARRSERMLLILPVSSDSAEKVARRIAETYGLQGGRVAVVALAAPAHRSEAVRLSLAGAAAGDKGPSAEGASHAGGLQLYRPATDATSSVRSRVHELAGENDLLLAALPELGSPVTAALLEPGAPVVLAVERGVTSREDLRRTMETLSLVGALPVAVVVSDPEAPRDQRG